MGKFDASEEASKLQSDAKEGISISDAYNSLNEEQRQAVFDEMTNSDSADENLSDLILTGLDTNGDHKPDELKDILNPKTGLDLYNRPGEEDHSEDAWKGRMGPLLKSDPEFRAQFREIMKAGGAYESPINGVSPSAFRQDALKTMIEEHGIDRVKETLAGLEEIGGSKEFYAHSLHKGYNDGAGDIERKMGYLNTLMEPGNIEAAQTLSNMLTEEGFTKKLSLEELADPQFVKMLSENPVEREAYKDFSSAPMGPMMGFYENHGESIEDLKPSEKLALYKEYEKEWKSARAEEARPYREELEAHGKPAKEVLVDAMKNNKVLMLGELHTEKSPHREGMTPLIDDLKEAGATHFVVEMSPEQLESYLEDGNMEHLPSGLRHQDYVDLLAKVQEEKIPIIAANSTGTDQERDNHMASVISDILEEDPNNKVVFWVGNLHAADTSAGANLSAANLLRDKGIPIATVMEQSPATGLHSLWNKVEVDEPTAIRTKDTPKISELEFPVIGNDIEESYGLWDIVVVYPREEA